MCVRARACVRMSACVRVRSVIALKESILITSSAISNVYHYWPGSVRVISQLLTSHWGLGTKGARGPGDEWPGQEAGTSPVSS